MRINVYSQELTKEVAPVAKTAETGVTHYGVRIFFDGSPRLHNVPGDDDRSAVTYWIPDTGSFTAYDLCKVFLRAAFVAAHREEGYDERAFDAALQEILNA